MRPLIQEIQTAHTPESLVENLRGESGIILLRSNSFDSPQARYSFVAANPSPENAAVPLPAKVAMVCELAGHAPNARQITGTTEKIFL